MKPVGLLLIFAMLSTAAFGQSIADVAKKERDRQRAAESKVVVKSNEPPTATAAAATPATTPTASTKAESKPNGPTDNFGHDEKYWRAAFDKAREDAKRAEQKVQLLDLKVKDLNTALLRQSDIYNREYRVGPEITAAQKDLDDARKDADQAKKKISDLEDELRKAGGPPGWAR